MANEFQCPKKMNEQELGGDEVFSPSSLFYCRGDCKTLATKQPADVTGCQLGSLQDDKLLTVVTLE